MSKLFVRLAIPVGVLLLALVAFWLWPRDLRISDGVVELSADVTKTSVTATVKNIGTEPIAVEHCTFHTSLRGGILQPSYKPCAERLVTVAPGQSVTDTMPVLEWNSKTPVYVTVRYQIGNEPRKLNLPLR